MSLLIFHLLFTLFCPLGCWFRSRSDLFVRFCETSVQNPSVFSAQGLDHYVCVLITVFLLKWFLNWNSNVELPASVSVSHSFRSERSVLCVRARVCVWAYVLGRVFGVAVVSNICEIMCV